MEQFAKIFQMDTNAIARITTSENTANVNVNIATFRFTTYYNFSGKKLYV